MSVLRRLVSDPYSRRMLYFSVAYSLYLFLPMDTSAPLSEGSSGVTTRGYDLSGYYGIVTALAGFLCASLSVNSSVFPSVFLAKIALISTFIYSNYLVLWVFYSTYIYLVEFYGYRILLYFLDFPSSFLLFLSPLLLIWALLKTPNRTVET